MSLRSSIANDLAEATIKIAMADHYLVGYSQDVQAITWENFHDAHAVLIEREHEAGNASMGLFDLAFAILDAECFRIHRTHLST